MTTKAGSDRWRARPVIAGVLRLLIVAVPLLVGYAATILCLHLMRSQVASSRWWLLVPAAVSIVACISVERVTRRALPLAALLKLSMLFPDRAPSRFKVARKAVSAEAKALRSSPNDAGASAEHALALITALTAHDRRTRGHSERVRLFTDLLGEQLRLPREARDKLRWSALLHDIGKLQVAVEILNKPAKLNASEWEVIAAHPANGEELLAPLIAWLGEWGKAVRHHHEKFDGTGYPDGLAGTHISRAGRIVAIADSYEVMTAHRAYKKPMATVAARAELTRCAGTQFDPAYVRAFLGISLPRLLWAMGPGSLLMNLPLLRILANTANKGTLATVQSGALSATAAAAIVGVAGVGVTDRPASHSNIVGSPAASQPAIAPAPKPNAPKITPVLARPSAPTRPVGPPVPPTAALPQPITAPTPVQPPPVPLPPSSSTPDMAAPTVEFLWVPFPLIGTSDVSVGISTSADAAGAYCAIDSEAPTPCTAPTVTMTGLSDGPHTFTVWAVDRAGQAGPAASTDFTVDTHAATVAWTSVPPPRIAANTATLSFSTADSTAVAWCSVDGSAAARCTGSISLGGLSDGAHSVTVYTVTAAGVAGPAIQATFTVDTSAPALNVVQAPAPITNSADATIAFALDDPTAVAYCSVDGAAPSPCSSPMNLTGLSDGSHSVELYARDVVGNIGTTQALEFTVDTTAPHITSIDVPASPVPSKSVSIPFTTDDPSAHTWCYFDGDSAAATACTSPVQSPILSDGSHTIDVYAVDAAGNVGPTAQATFVISANAPTVKIDAPSPLSASSSGSISFSVDDATATAWCSLDGLSAARCTSPFSYTGVPDGSHTLAVYAVSAGGVQGATSYVSFSTDTQAPVVTITAAPVGTVRSDQASLNFSVNDPSATAWCFIDGGPATACTSPLDLGSLAAGHHIVSVYAVDAAGNAGPARQASFTIDNTAPTVTLTGAPPASTSNRSATVSFTTDDATATTWCALDSTAAQVCQGKATYSGLADGSHTVTVYAVDAAGNRGPSVSASFTVTAAAPVLLTTPPSVSPAKDVTFSWISRPGLSYQYSYDGTHWSPTNTRASYAAKLQPGTYTFQLRGIDANGAPTAVVSFKFKVL